LNFQTVRKEGKGILVVVRTYTLLKKKNPRPKQLKPRENLKNNGRKLRKEGPSGFSLGSAVRGKNDWVREIGRKRGECRSCPL